MISIVWMIQRPLQKNTLDNLLGYIQGDKDYKIYFDSFIAAQRKREISDKADDLKAHYPWANYFQEFLTAKQASATASYQDFQKKLAKLV